ncbi:MAG: ribonuclease HII [Melioribacteraceae bacterium]|nr:ribonuclease HII [Melioribacteraceae bacterium]
MQNKIFDNSFLSDEIKIIAGVDEAGRGPLSGPVVAAAVIFDNSVFIEGIMDSKKIIETKRELLYEQIISKSLCYGIGIIDNIEIDEINILQAALKAMKIAVSQISITPDLVLIDGNKSFITELNTKTIIKGDDKSFSIAAASIIAKVTRDRIVRNQALLHPVYKWEKNKGYATKEHISAIKKCGVTHLHRMTFLSRILDESK